MILFATVDPRPVHFMGIAGAGMSGLALLARQQGIAITGCDNDPSGAADLAALGVEIWRGHDPGHVAGARSVVVTAAVPGDHPELERARALGVPVVRRADALGQAVAGGTVVAVSGTHGKTTTTVMVTEALAAAGRDPTGLAGGRVARWGGNARMGGRDLYVVEADEYDRAFLSRARCEWCRPCARRCGAWGLAPTWTCGLPTHSWMSRARRRGSSCRTVVYSRCGCACRDSTTCAMRPRRSRWCTSWGRTSSGRSRRSRNSPEWGAASSGWVKREA